MNLLLKSIFLILFVPAFFVDVLPDRFYRLRHRYPLLLLFQTGFISAILYLLFRDMFPIVSTISFFNSFSLTLQLDEMNTLFQFWMSISLFILLLTCPDKDKGRYLWIIVSLYLLVMAGNTGTIFLASFIYFFLASQPGRGKKLHVITYLPIFLFTTAYFLFNMLHEPSSLATSIHEISAVIPVSGSVLYLILSGYFLIAVIRLSDIIQNNYVSTEHAILELIISYFALLFIIQRLTGMMLNPHVFLMYWFIFASIILFVMMGALFFKCRRNQSYTPFMITFLLTLAFVFMSLRLFPVDVSVLHLQQRFITAFPLYILIIALFQNVFLMLEDDVTRFFAIIIFTIALILNPFILSGKVYAYTFLIFLHENIFGMTLLILFTLLSILSGAFLLILTNREEGKGTHFPGVMLMMAILFLMIHELGVFS
ncbi:MAG: hypothetical protein XD77_0960 [Marinimicrobia bacterium 46_47]|nr:MAG: hypothetical protein XD77_0960 [Marinimicrobia bacterium 46_47]